MKDDIRQQVIEDIDILVRERHEDGETTYTREDACEHLRKEAQVRMEFEFGQVKALKAVYMAYITTTEDLRAQGRSSTHYGATLGALRAKIANARGEVAKCRRIIAYTGMSDELLKDDDFWADVHRGYGEWEYE